MSMLASHAHGHRVHYGFVLRGSAGFGIAALVVAAIGALIIGVSASDEVLFAAAVIGGLLGGAYAYRLERHPPKQ